MTIIGIATVSANRLLSTIKTVPLPVIPAQHTCPSWCAGCVGGDVIHGVQTSVLHEAVLVDVTGVDPAGFGDEDTATARVYVEQVDDPEEPAGAPRLVLALAEGDEGAVAGEGASQAWTGTPEQARQLAAALYRAAAIAEAAR